MAEKVFIAVTSFKDIYRREPVRDKSFVMPFGKWQGIEIGEVMQDDPDYLMWLVENTDFDIHADLLDEICTRDFARTWRNTMAQMIEDW